MSVDAAWERFKRHYRPDAPLLRGFVGTKDGPTHWTASSSPGSKQIERRPVQVPTDPQFWGVEPLRKRKPTERLDQVLGCLVTEARKTQQMYGYPVLPRSVLKEVVAESWRLGDPIEMEWLESLARRLLEEEERKSSRSLIPSIGSERNR